MKKIVYLFVFIGLSIIASAQAPQAFKYQAVARNTNGDPVVDQDIAVKMSILAGTYFGDVVYSELHETATNNMGLFDLEIGNPIEVLTGSFTDIDWSSPPYYLKVEIDLTATGSNFILMGTSELLSVPYALYAEQAGNMIAYSAGSGINITNHVISNTAPDKTVNIASGTGISATGTYPNFTITNTNPDQVVAITSGTGISATGTYPNFNITNTQPNASHTGDATGDGALTVTGLQGRPVYNAAPSIGQVLKWTGNRWAPSTLAPYTAGTGIDITDNIVTNTSPDQNVTLTSGTGISVSGTYPGFTITNAQPNATHTGDATGGNALSVVKIQGRTVSPTAPTTDQVLQWNGSQWIPATLPAPTQDWSLTGNSGTSPSTNFMGTTDNKALKIKVNNQIAAWLDPSLMPGNTSFGYQSLNAINSGSSAGYYNVACGYQSLKNNTTGTNNTSVGFWTLFNNSEGNFNAAFGNVALYTNTIGKNNTAVGDRALYYNSSGSYNVAIGSSALGDNETGLSNIAIGDHALYMNTNRSCLLAIGDSALFHNGYGATLPYDATGNTAVGSKAMCSNTTGRFNTALGYQTLYGNLAGGENTAVGYRALFNNQGGETNSATGVYASYSNTNGDDNTAFGYKADYYNETGNGNTAIGSLAYFTISSSNSTCIGFGSGWGSGNNKVAIGNTSVSWIGGEVSWSTYSDERIYNNVRENVPGLSFIDKLRPVTYNLNIHQQDEMMGKDPVKSKDWVGKYDIEKTRMSGFIAQEVEQAAMEIGYDFSGVDAPEQGEIYSLRYTDFIMPLVKAVQEQQDIIENQQTQINELIRRLKQLENK